MALAIADRYASAVAGKLGLDPTLVHKMTINLDHGNVVTVHVEIMVPREQVDSLLMIEPEEPASKALLLPMTVERGRADG